MPLFALSPSGTKETTKRTKLNASSARPKSAHLDESEQSLMPEAESHRAKEPGCQKAIETQSQRGREPGSQRARKPLSQDQESQRDRELESQKAVSQKQPVQEPAGQPEPAKQSDLRNSYPSKLFQYPLLEITLLQ